MAAAVWIGRRGENFVRAGKKELCTRLSGPRMIASCKSKQEQSWGWESGLDQMRINPWGVVPRVPAGRRKIVSVMLLAARAVGPPDSLEECLKPVPGWRAGWPGAGGRAMAIVGNVRCSLGLPSRSRLAPKLDPLMGCAGTGRTKCDLPRQEKGPGELGGCSGARIRQRTHCPGTMSPFFV